LIFPAFLFLDEQGFMLATSTPILTAQSLVKTYRSGGASPVQALRGLSFHVPEGVVFSILGPNGAGKTTLLRILTTLSKPDSGEAWFLGTSIQEHPRAVRQKLGVVFQNNQFNKYLTVWQNLRLHAEMHGLSEAETEAFCRPQLERMGVWQRRHALPEAFSGGQQRRLAIVRALMHNPRLLFLDEPTTGLDPEARFDLWEQIQQLRERQTTVILTTHYLDEAERLSDEILLIQKGQHVLQGTPDALKGRLSGMAHFEVRLLPETPEPVRVAFEQALHGTPSLQQSQLPLPKQSPNQTTAFVYQWRFADKAQAQGVWAHLPGQWVQSAQWVNPTLETVFIELLKGNEAFQQNAHPSLEKDDEGSGPISMPSESASNEGVLSS
jgi:ABC-2 type transport system ATP-binding protein